MTYKIKIFTEIPQINENVKRVTFSKIMSFLSQIEIGYDTFLNSFFICKCMKIADASFLNYMKSNSIFHFWILQIFQKDPVNFWTKFQVVKTDKVMRQQLYIAQNVIHVTKNSKLWSYLLCGNNEWIMQRQAGQLLPAHLLPQI